MTWYQVLAKEGDGWHEVADPVDAANHEQAIRRVVEDLDPSKVTGYWRAVPTRSWYEEEVKVEVQTERVVKFGKPGASAAEDEGNSGSAGGQT